MQKKKKKTKYRRNKLIQTLHFNSIDFSFNFVERKMQTLRFNLKFNI